MLNTLGQSLGELVEWIRVDFAMNFEYVYVITPKTNMAMENPPFEDVFPIENYDFPMSS